MKSFFGAYIFACLLLCSASSQADLVSAKGYVKGFVQVAADREIYVEYKEPQPGSPTLVLVNGLTYRIGHWDRFVKNLDPSFGLVRFDLYGQGATLLKYAPLLQVIPYKEQTKDIFNLLKKLGIRDAVHLLGLSYGGALALDFAATYPKMTASIILMAPFTAPIESQENWIKFQIQQTRMMYPFNPSTDEELYDYFLRQIIYTTYPSAEPVVLENPYKLEATFRLVQGVRRFLASRIVNRLPDNKLHLIVARGDQYIQNSVHDDFWESLPETARASRLYISRSEHKIPEAVPRYSAAWVNHILDHEPALWQGDTFEGNPYKGVAVSETQELADLAKE